MTQIQSRTCSRAPWSQKSKFQRQYRACRPCKALVPLAHLHAGSRSGYSAAVRMHESQAADLHGSWPDGLSDGVASFSLSTGAALARPADSFCPAHLCCSRLYLFSGAKLCVPHSGSVGCRSIRACIQATRANAYRLVDKRHLLDVVDPNCKKGDGQSLPSRSCRCSGQHCNECYVKHTSFDRSDLQVIRAAP